MFVSGRLVYIHYAPTNSCSSYDPPLPLSDRNGKTVTKYYNQRDVEGPAGDIPVDQLNPEQLQRYKAWKRSRLERGPIREVIVSSFERESTSFFLPRFVLLPSCA